MKREICENLWENRQMVVKEQLKAGTQCIDGVLKLLMTSEPVA